MPAKIILTLDQTLTEDEQEDLQYLLSDALSEFATRRSPAKVYVENRYPGAEYLFDKLEKIAQVERRIDLARKLHGAALHPVVVNETPVAPPTKTCDTCGYDVPSECDGLKCKGVA